VSIEYRFRCSDEFFAAAFAKYRKQLWWYGAFRLLKFIAALLLLGFAAFFALRHRFFAATGYLAIALLLVLAPRLDAWLLRRRLRKSPYHNDDAVVRISDEGVSVRGRSSEVRMDWSVITKARRFADGLMLFQGPHVFHWLPDSAFTGGSPSEAENLVRSRVTDYR